MKSIAEQVLGVAAIDEPDAIQTAYSTLTGLQGQELQAECERRSNYNLTDWNTVPAGEQEAHTTFSNLKHLFNEGRMRYANVLYDWPIYENIYKNLAQPPAERGEGWALQLGALTSLSAAAFSALSKEVYGARPLTVDLTGSPERARHGDFAIADATRLGLADNSMRLVQTNRLLHMLTSNENPDEPFLQTLNVFRSMYRVLQPGGHAILYEYTPGLNRAEHPEFSSPDSQDRIAEFELNVGMYLTVCGFAGIRIGAASHITDANFLFDRSRDFSKYEQSTLGGCIVAVAQKPMG